MSDAKIQCRACKSGLLLKKVPDAIVSVPRDAMQIRFGTKNPSQRVPVPLPFRYCAICKTIYYSGPSEKKTEQSA